MGVTVGRERRRVAIALACVVLVATGCGRGGDVDGSDKVIIDPAGRLDQNARQAIEQARVPDRHALVVAVESFDASEPLGPQADAAVDRLSKQCDSERRCDRRGIYVLLDADNGFPQLRVGSSLRLSAMWEGATYGPEYVAAQRAVAGLPPSQQAATFVPYSMDAVLAASEHRSWFERWSDNAATPGGYGDFATEFMADSYPGSGYYDHWLVRPLLHVQAFERRHLGTWFVSIALSCAVLFLLTRLLRAFARRFPQPWVRWPGIVVFIAVAMLAALIAVPISAAMVLQSGARTRGRRRRPTSLRRPPGVEVLGRGVGAGAEPLALGGRARGRGAPRRDRRRPDVGAIGNGVDLDEGQDARCRPGRRVANVRLRSGHRRSVPLPPVRRAGAGRRGGLQRPPGRAGGRRLDGVARRGVGEGVRGGRHSAGGRVLRPTLRAWRPDATEAAVEHGTYRHRVLGCRGVGGDRTRRLAWFGPGASLGPGPAPTVATAAPATTSVIPPFVPETGQWSLMPMVAKEEAAEGAEGDAIRYLQGVLRLAAGQPVEITGTFDASTGEAVRAVQSFMSLEPTGVVDAGTWAVIDQLAQTVVPQPAGP